MRLRCFIARHKTFGSRVLLFLTICILFQTVIESLLCWSPWWEDILASCTILEILTANPIPTEQPATNRAHELLAGTPTATTTSSPGTSPKANKPLAIQSACKIKRMLLWQPPPNLCFTWKKTCFKMYMGSYLWWWNTFVWVIVLSSIHKQPKVKMFFSPTIKNCSCIFVNINCNDSNQEYL